MPMNLTLADLKEMHRKYKAGEAVDLEDAKDGFTVVAHKHEITEAMKGDASEAGAEIESLENGAIVVRIVKPIKARVRLDDIKVSPDRISFNTNLSVLLRKPIELMLRAKGENRIILDGKRVIMRVPPRAKEWGEVHSMSITTDKITVTGIVKKTPCQQISS